MTPKITCQQKATNKLLRQEKLQSEFIKKSSEIHKDDDDTPLYSYEKCKYVTASKKVSIICGVHGEFLQTPNNHLNGHGCKKCGNEIIAKKQLRSQKDIIDECEQNHPGLLDYSKTVYTGRDNLSLFICKKCRTEYSRTPAGMLVKGCSHNCPTCIGNYPDTTDTFIEKATKKHGGIYNYTRVVYVNSIKKVTIVCPKGHIFEQSPGHHLNGDGCRRCRGYYRTTEDFITLSQQKFGEGLFSYDDVVFVGMTTPVTLICPFGHMFDTTPDVHLREESLGGCKDCQRENSSIRMSYTQSQWIELAIAKHGDAYLYHKVVYLNSQTGVCVVCTKHGEFHVTPACHLGGTGCRKCGIERSVASKLYTEADTVEAFAKARILHNRRYEYIRIFSDNSRLMIELKCPTHGIISQRLDHHLHGHGCDRCIPKHSKQQIEWLQYCSISCPGIRHAENSGEYRIPGTNFKADGFDADTNTVYEYQGDFWHGNPSVFKSLDINPRTNTTYGSLFEKTQKKITNIKSIGYRVVEVWERDWELGKKAVVAIQKLWKMRPNI